MDAEKLKDADYRAKIASMMQAAGLGIQSLEINNSARKVSVAATELLNNVCSILDAVHQVHEEDGSQRLYKLNMTEESNGTKRYLDLIVILKEVLDNGGLLVADEMDAYLHPLLTRHVLSLFGNDVENPRGAQLIFTTHNTHLLDVDVLRLDQIWFAEKDGYTCAAELFSLYDFSVRKDSDMEISYLLGRYGAIPFLKEKG